MKSDLHQGSFVKRRSPKVRFGPSGVHLFDRATGANLLIDEWLPPQAEWTIGPRQVSVALTNTCDLTCSHCYAPKTRASLSFPQLVAWLNEIDGLGTFGVGFGGGEPTLYPRFIDLCVYAARNTQLAVTFTTHGHHLDDQLLSKLEDSVHFIRISMDGVGATYNRLRGRSFDALLRRLKALNGIVRFGINYVVNSSTLPEIDEAAVLSQDLGASEFLLLPERPRGATRGVDDHTREALRAWVRSYSGRLRLAISESDAEGFPICNPVLGETGLRAYVHIDAAGVLKRSSFETIGVAIGSDTFQSALMRLQKSEPGVTL